MRVPYRATVRRGEKVEDVDAIVWINELPPEYRRGRNRRMKSRKHKQARQQRPDEEKVSRPRRPSKKRYGCVD